MVPYTGIRCIFLNLTSIGVLANNYKYLNAGSSVRVLSVGVGLPGVGVGVVALHGWTFLLALPVIIKVSASLEQEKLLK